MVYRYHEYGCFVLLVLSRIAVVVICIGVWGYRGWGFWDFRVQGSKASRDPRG